MTIINASTVVHTIVVLYLNEYVFVNVVCKVCTGGTLTLLEVEMRCSSPFRVGFLFEFFGDLPYLPYVSLFRCAR